MKINVKSTALSLLLMLGASASADAAIYRWSFNYNEGGTGVFAFLDYNTVTGDFRIDDNGGQYAGFTATTFASQAGVNGIAFDFVGAQALANTTPSTVTGGLGNGVSIGALGTTTQPGLPGLAWDIGFATASNATGSEIRDGQTTVFNFGTVIPFANINNIALRYNTSNGALNSSGVWVVGQAVNNGAPVPEAQTSAMMALGLGVLGFVARRRKKLN